jgi:uncharacterized protein Veg
MEVGKMSSVISLVDIKRSLEQHVGQKVVVRTNGGRKKILESIGVLKDIYPSVFTVRLEKEPQQSAKLVSYSYADVLTSAIELLVCEEQGNVALSFK